MIIFKDWLRGIGALEEFERYFTNDWDSLDYDSPYEYLSNAFDWTDACSGYNYWESIDREWRAYLSSTNKRVVFDKSVAVMSEEGVEKLKVVEKPIQYQIEIDTFDRMKANASFEEIIGGCKLNIDKYIWRKKGSDREDLIKAKDYIDLWIWALDNKIEKDK